MRPLFVSLLSFTVALAACGDDSETPGGGAGGGGAPGTGGDGGSGGAPLELEPGPAFDRFCNDRAWDAQLEPAIEGELSGDYLGVIAEPLPEGTLDSMKFIPGHPFHVQTIRVAFGGEPGTVRVRLMTTFGRSYPGGWPDIDAAGANLMPPLDVDVTAPDPETYLELDVSAHGIFLQPTQHYVVVVEHLGDQPQVAIDSLPVGDAGSRALIHVPGQDTPYGLGEANFRIELGGDHFCVWTERERWFAERDAPFTLERSSYVQLADLDGDGHDDVVIQAPGPKAYRGDGAGNFEPMPFEPFADVPAASLLIFADLDGDGDRDAFAGTYVSVNTDGDGYTLADGDCNDVDAAIRPNAVETTNRRDDDCDGVADDGTDLADDDGDGASIAGGDCDDTLSTVAPGLTEALDGLDNDCNGQVDETFDNRILLNDGSGAFVALPNAGVESIDPTTTAAFADTDGDGDLNLYWGNWLEHYPDFPAVQGRFMTGAGDGTFGEATALAGLVPDTVRPTYGVGFTDHDSDGDQDLYVGNYQLSDNNLFDNQGDGTFVDVAGAIGFAHDGIETRFAQYPGGHSYGAAFGDVDNDGDIDAFLSNLSHPRTQPWADPSQFLFNDGTSTAFVERREELGILYDEGDVNAAFGDWDNDGDLDLYVSSLYPTHYARLYRNDGPDGYVDVSYEANLVVHLAVGVAFGDIDEDGDLDLLAAEGIGPRFVHQYENRVGQDNGWLELELEGTGANRDAIGARVTLTADGVTQLRDVEAGTGHHLQHSRIVHFGLGDAASIDALEVRWPSGLVEAIDGADPRGRYRIVEGDGGVSQLDP